MVVNATGEGIVEYRCDVDGLEHGEESWAFMSKVAAIAQARNSK